MSAPSDYVQPTLMWSPKNLEDNQLIKFRDFVNKRYNLSLATYDQLWQWSSDQIENFWESVWIFTNIKASVPYTQVLEPGVRMDRIPKWFLDARLNYAENILAYKDDHVAIIGAGEGDTIEKITYAELHERVRVLAGALRAHGVRPGDRIAGYVPNSPQTVICMLAATSLGAIWSSASPDFGVTGILDRFSQIQPKIIFSINAVLYNGKTHDHLEKLKAVVDGLDSLEKVVVFPFVDQPFDLSGIPKSSSLAEFLSTSDNGPLVFEQLPFDHPLFILYSSGTTGKPKCIVHGAGGVLIQHKKEHIIHGSMGRNDIMLYYTTTGWMMWNWLVGGLLAGSTIVCYDGSPFKPSTDRLWRLSEQLGVTIFGTSAKYIQGLEEAGFKPREHFGLSTLRTIYTTGSPLKPESYDFIYRHIKEDVLVGSITGGTDIVSLFAGHNAAGPVYRGEIQCRCLGMAIEAWSESGKPVLDETGDLVCTKPFPVMPVGFWNDPNHEKYRGAYFDVFEGVWHHGDFVYINSKTGGVIMLGRSDGTLKPAGVRFGSAELYNIVESFPQVSDSLVVGQKYQDDERVIMFLKMAEGHAFNSEIVNAIKAKIRAQLSPRHVPAIVLETQDIPYTLTGKKVEVAVKRIINGATIVPSSTLSNPDSLKLYYNIPELQQ
ncbi:uncharacterized protein BJ171DRAFT_241045 [Polychytrium aggregatum]|uniref:uncharacterized protein n=1 Tax=Polychytrium aggregatum TaxID=110093 RepID=UPI0022FEABFA|nr:uncharacterized protein BJ171DRAFT_241045 [Polychytrium aggregatum]KAI9197150.1 hypothetical protein BJ171DRAFT_241045 [Polychytrium aggregatum]